MFHSLDTTPLLIFRILAYVPVFSLPVIFDRWWSLIVEVFFSAVALEHPAEMYNGIGLTTARGSGTNGYVQRNLAFVNHTKDKVKYKTEEEIQKLDLQNQRKPNQEILDHERKRKLELKCLEFRDKLEDQEWVSFLTLCLA